ncbi:4-carboxymuconolactone decarboxylase [Streptomyces sp. NPDC127098]|uniref:bifunctional 3-oxoadipate enol-lactonase/4-carboxymuconolactone decarboxylase PcaDC n=1 Tax=Streptomyces sp. NPDC127098 TaxID=3347137 RepID=UPI00365278A3
MLHHRLDGPPDGHPLILGPALGTSLAVWEPQLPALTRRHRVLRFDLPGHGGQRDQGPAPDSVAGLAELVLALADAQGWDAFRYAGISIGGAIGLQLALDHPQRVTSLALLCSSAHFGPPEPWHARAATVRAEGSGALVPGRREAWFTDGFTDEARAAALLADLAAVDPDRHAACCAALADYDLRHRLPEVSAPTLVLAGRDDPATTTAHARELADAIPDASLTELAGAAHLANVERPAAVSAALLAHLSPGDPTDRYAAGLAVRRAVLGDAHVDRALADTTDFAAPFQDLITRYAWGEIWTRPGLSRHIRSCVTLTALVAGGHHRELALHVRAALRNGLTPEEIREVLLQSAIYLGVPAANAAFAVAEAALTDQPPAGE